MKKWRNKNPDKAKAISQRRSRKLRGGNLEKKWGMSPSDYDQLLYLQLGSCAICGKKYFDRPGTRLAVDHEHNTMVVRGLLCRNCNLAVGLIGDDPEIASKISKYLSGDSSYKFMGIKVFNNSKNIS